MLELSTAASAGSRFLLAAGRSLAGRWLREVARFENLGRDGITRFCQRLDRMMSKMRRKCKRRKGGRSRSLARVEFGQETLCQHGQTRPFDWKSEIGSWDGEGSGSAISPGWSQLGRLAGVHLRGLHAVHRIHHVLHSGDSATPFALSRVLWSGTLRSRLAASIPNAVSVKILNSRAKSTFNLRRRAVHAPG